jgi:hypothetical protein
MATTRSTTFTTTVWVINWIHDNTANCRANSKVTALARFSKFYVDVISV